MNYWQVASGDGRRDYSSVFLKYGIMLIGPGDPGSYSERKDFYKKDKSILKSDASTITAFAEQVNEGDIVVLKRPSGKLWEVIAVGTAKGKYKHMPIFNDVEGWDLQHCRQVEWYKPKQANKITGLTRGTFKKVNKRSAIQDIDRLLRLSIKVSVEPIPNPVGELKDEDLIEILINHGLRIKDAEDFAHTIRRIRRLVKWYHDNGTEVSEHETRTFLIIPLLLALGWTEQKLKIEWNNVDIAFFEKPYNKKTKDLNECIIILESKKLWDGLFYATDQANSYAARYPRCGRLIVSDGCCYRLYKREKGILVYSAYLNVLKQKYKHPYEPGIGGASDVFLSLMAKA